LKLAEKLAELRRPVLRSCLIVLISAMLLVLIAFFSVWGFVFHALAWVISVPVFRL